MESTEVKFKKPRKAEKRREKIPCLIAVEGDHIGEVFHLAHPSMVIGRVEGSEIMLVEDGVSRSHARIDLHENTYTIVDLSSTNGTYVNGELVSQAALHEGDKIHIGDVVLRFSYQDLVDLDYQENLRKRMMRDGLTKAYNRRYFIETLSREINYAVRSRQPLSCILLDIDHLKNANDSYGFQVGDHILKTLAGTLAREVRNYDLMARFGGEEFAVLLRSTALENALIFAERLRKLVESTPISVNDASFPITISLGVAAVDPDRAPSVDDLLKQADRFLNEAKTRGCNRVMSQRSID